MFINFFYIIVLLYYVAGLAIYVWISKNKYISEYKPIKITTFNDGYDQLLLES